MNNKEITKYPDTIPLSEGTTLTTNWRNYISAVDANPNYIRAFNIPMTDIQQLAQFTKCTSVRAYLAMVTPGDVATLKVILVPVDANGKDITGIPGVVEGVTDSTVFDFTSPCPQTCDINSPLFQ
jgi:hypothetical protein